MLSRQLDKIKRTALFCSVPFCFVLVTVLSVLLMSACAPSTTYKTYDFSGSIFGTQYQIIFVSDKKIDKETIEQEIQQKLDYIDQLASHYRQDSALARLNKAPVNTDIAVNPDLYYLLSLAKDIYQRTHGFFDITLAPLINFWGFGTDKQRKKLPEKHRVTALLKQIGSDKFTLFTKAEKCYLNKQLPLSFNLSAITEGYAADQIASLLESHAIKNYLVSIAGAIRVKGHKASGQPWQIAIEAPLFNQRAPYKKINANRMDYIAMSTSGDYRNFYLLEGQMLTHIIDPTTGWPIENTFASVTVIADTAAEADAYATALTAMGREGAWQFAQQYALKAYFIARDQQNNNLTGKATDAFSVFMAYK